MRQTRFLLAAAFVIASPFALAQTTGTVNTTPSHNVGETPAAQKAERTTTELNDAQIAGILNVVDNQELESARMAQDKVKTKDVRNYVKQIVTDHSRSHQLAQQALNKANIKAVETSLAEDLRTQAQAAMKDLEGKSGAEFERGYLQAQIQMHRQVLDTIDTQLMPQAQSEAMKKHLQVTRPKIAAHLRQAETLQGKLKQ